MTHKINRLQVELRTSDRELGDALLARVSQIHGNAIAPAIEHVCDALDPDADLAAIQHVEVDLGVLSEAAFELELVEKLIPALRAALAAALRARPRSKHGVAASLELVELFALTGCLPWWADARDRRVVADHVTRVADAAGDDLLALLRRTSGDRGALERIARHCDHAALDALWRRAGVAREPPRADDATGQRAVLTSLLDVSRTAPEAAVHENGYVRSPRVPPRGQSAPGEDNRRTGAPVIHPSVEPVVPAGVNVARVHPSDEPVVPAGVNVARVHPSDEPAARSEPDVRANASRAERPPDRTGAERAAVGHADPAAPVRVERDAANPDGTQAPSERVGAEHDRSRRAEPASGDVRVRRDHGAGDVRRRALASLDEVYVGDAGLVILWPFLERLFARVGLLGHDRRFVDDEAAMRAVALVEAIAVPDTELLEFQLPLAKLLCGRELESDFELAQPIPHDLIAEGERMLSAVIEHASTLGELSIDGFRRTFVQRQGALTTRDGAWLLEVERQTQDILLDRFPWSWTWVKLPWMPDPLRVEW